MSALISHLYTHRALSFSRVLHRSVLLWIIFSIFKNQTWQLFSCKFYLFRCLLSHHRHNFIGDKHTELLYTLYFTQNQKMGAILHIDWNFCVVGKTHFASIVIIIIKRIRSRYEHRTYYVCRFGETEFIMRSPSIETHWMVHFYTIYPTLGARLFKCCITCGDQLLLMCILQTKEMSKKRKRKRYGSRHFTQ